MISLFHYFRLLAQSCDASPLRHDIDGWPIVFHLRSMGVDCHKLDPAQTARGLAPPEIIDIAQLSSQPDEGKIMALPNGASFASLGLY